MGYLDDVTCSGAGACIANGFLEYAGEQWSEVGTGSAGERLPSRVTCGSLDCVGTASVSGGGILIEQRTSGSWSALATLMLSGIDLYQLVANDIACAGAHCVVVGSQSVGGVAIASGLSETLIAEGQGSQWAVVSSPNVTGDSAIASTT